MMRPLFFRNWVFPRESENADQTDAVCALLRQMVIIRMLFINVNMVLDSRSSSLDLQKKIIIFALPFLCSACCVREPAISNKHTCT